MVSALIARRNCLRFDSTRFRVSQSVKPRFKTRWATCLLGLDSRVLPPFAARSRLAPPQRVLNAWTSQFNRAREGDSSTFKCPASRTSQPFLAGRRDGRIGPPGRRFFETVTIMFCAAACNLLELSSQLLQDTQYIGIIAPVLAAINIKAPRDRRIGSGHRRS
jgi:hypothetical protein